MFFFAVSPHPGTQAHNVRVLNAPRPVLVCTDDSVPTLGAFVPMPGILPDLMPLGKCQIGFLRMLVTKLLFDRQIYLIDFPIVHRSPLRPEWSAVQPEGFLQRNAKNLSGPPIQVGFPKFFPFLFNDSARIFLLFSTLEGKQCAASLIALDALIPEDLLDALARQMEDVSDFLHGCARKKQRHDIRVSLFPSNAYVFRHIPPYI
jgi:hypothetical protein